MALRQRLEEPGAARREREPDDAAVVAVARSADEPGGLAPIDQLDGAVVAKEQGVGDLADRRGAGSGVSPDGEEQLVLGWGQAGGSRLLLAPPEEVPQADTQGEQSTVVGVPDGSMPRHAMYRNTIYLRDVRRKG